jgi:hypothetical protein
MAQAQKKSKPTSKSSRRKASGKTRRRRNPQMRLNLEQRLPSRALEIDAIRTAATRIDGSDALQDIEVAAQNLTDALRDWADKIQLFEANTRNVAEERLDDLRTRLGEIESLKGIGHLPERFGDTATAQIDEMLDRLGLMRKAVHDTELEKLRKRMKAAQKAAATRRKKAAAAKRANAS